MRSGQDNAFVTLFHLFLFFIPEPFKFHDIFQFTLKIFVIIKLFQEVSVNLILAPDRVQIFVELRALSCKRQIFHCQEILPHLVHLLGQRFIIHLI